MFAKPFPPEKLANVGADGFVSAADVLFLRRMAFKDGVVSTEELDALFTLAGRAPDGDPEWGQFFEEAACDFYLNEEEPKGYFTSGEFETLKARVTRDGATASGIELRLMVKLLENAAETPPDMRAFVGDQMRQRFLREGGVARSQVDLLRRFIFAKGGEGNIDVTRAEAELLLDLNDASGGVGNDPSWTELFVKSLAAHMMAHSGYRALSREEARRLHEFASDHKADIGGFFSKMLKGGLNGFRKDEPSPQAERNT
ncbi:MAG: hypothetical protein ABL957_09490, partial [Parvularculaceae bacterium]